MSGWVGMVGNEIGEGSGRESGKSKAGLGHSVVRAGEDAGVTLVGEDIGAGENKGAEGEAWATIGDKLGNGETTTLVVGVKLKTSCRTNWDELLKEGAREVRDRKGNSFS